MANVRWILMLLACPCLASPLSASDTRAKKEIANAKKEAKVDNAKAAKQATADAKKEGTADRLWAKREAAADKKEWRARHGYHSFSHNHFVVYRNYYVRTYGLHRCPPGYVISRGSCYWPGYSRKRYQVGELIPDDVPVLLAPVELAREMGPPPPGYLYAVVDGDLLVILIESHLVVDYIDGAYLD